MLEHVLYNSVNFVNENYDDKLFVFYARLFCELRLFDH